MDYSGRGRRCTYVPSSVGSRESDMDKRASVWSDADWKGKPSNLAAPRSRLYDHTEGGEDYMSGLVEEIAHSMLEKKEECWSTNEASSKLSEPGWGTQVLLSTSPQSTLAGMSSWDLLSPGASSNGGVSSGVSSPSTPVEASQVRKDEEHALDLLYAELLRLKMKDEMKLRQQQLQLQYQHLLWKTRQRHLNSVESFELLKTQYHPKLVSSTSGFHRSKFRSDNDAGSNQSRCRKQSAPAFQNICSKQGRSRGRGPWTPAASATATALPSVVEQTSYCEKGLGNGSGSGSGMRAVFLGVPGARECGGTGVFLPRRVGSGHDSQRKPACSTVLLPARIVQALNLNVEGTLACPHVNAPSSTCLRRDISSHVRIAEVASLQEVAPNVCLPTEWTY